MKYWFKFIVKGADGTYEGTEFVKAETEQEAIAVIKDNWIDYPYTNDVEECTFEPDCLSYKEQDECIRKDAVEAFWEYVISIGAYEQMRQLAVYQDVIFSYKKDQTKLSGNGYCEKAYTAEDAEFARIQIEHLLKSCQ